MPPLGLTFQAALLVIAAGLSTAARAQDRPLKTDDAETVPAGTLRAELGFDFLQDVGFPLSGLRGDETSIGVVDFRMGVGKIAEIEVEGSIQNFLDVKSQGTSFVPNLSLTGVNSTHDTGDFTLATKVRLLKNEGLRPGLAFKFGFVMPNSNQARGIGTNTTNVFAMIALQEQLRKLSVFGDLGIEILQAPNALFTQNDVLIYGGAFKYPIHRRISVVGEVHGLYSSRSVNDALVGTQSTGQARLGLQIMAGGLIWDLAGIRGLNKYDARSGFTFGLSKDFRLFDYNKMD
jgi:outer membrane putative beta-barrel porin/alpha-amylase